MAKSKVEQIAEGMINSVIENELVETVAKQRTETCNSCPYMSENVYRDITEGKEIPDDISVNQLRLLKARKAVRDGNHCVLCACYIHTKTRSLSTSCPKEYWIEHK